MKQEESLLLRLFHTCVLKSHSYMKDLLGLALPSSMCTGGSNWGCMFSFTDLTCNACSSCGNACACLYIENLTNGSHPSAEVTYGATERGLQRFTSDTDDQAA